LHWVGFSTTTSNTSETETESNTVIHIALEHLGCVPSDLKTNPRNGKPYPMKWARMTMPWSGDANLCARWVRLMHRQEGAEIWLGWCALQWVALSATQIGEIESLESVQLISRVPLYSLQLALAWAVKEGIAESDECPTPEVLLKNSGSTPEVLAKSDECSTSEVLLKNFGSTPEVLLTTLGQGTGRHVPFCYAATAANAGEREDGIVGAGDRGIAASQDSGGVDAVSLPSLDSASASPPPISELAAGDPGEDAIPDSLPLPPPPMRGHWPWAMLPMPAWKIPDADDPEKSPSGWDNPNFNTPGEHDPETEEVYPEHRWHYWFHRDLDWHAYAFVEHDAAAAAESARIKKAAAATPPPTPAPPRPASKPTRPPAPKPAPAPRKVAP
jgi:hypothetical protein